MSQTDIVERLRGCTDKKYPGFQNLNTEAADTITQLRERLDAVEKENAALRKQWQTYRHTLNQIAWPDSYGLKGLTFAAAQRAAADTLQIGTLTAESGTEGKG